MKHFVEMVTIGSVSFGLLLSLKYILKGRQQAGSAWIGVFVLLLAGCIAEFTIKDSVTISSIIGGTYWLFGPVLYLYVKMRTHLIDRITSKHLLHFLPCLCYFCLLLFGESLASVIALDVIDVILYELVFIHIISYFAFAWRTVRASKAVKSYSLYDRMTYSFLLTLSTVAIALFGGSWMLINTTMFTGWQSPPVVMHIIQLGLCVYILLIALLNTDVPAQEADTARVY